jgi:hypothetical protein
MSPTPFRIQFIALGLKKEAEAFAIEAAKAWVDARVKVA